MRYQRNLNWIPYHSTVSFICINKNFHFRSPSNCQSHLQWEQGDHVSFTAVDEALLDNKSLSADLCLFLPCYPASFDLLISLSQKRLIILL